MAETYIVLCGQVVGNVEAGFEIVYGSDYRRFRVRENAIRHGMKIRDSDDFNIGVLRDNRLVSVDWMDEAVETDPHELRKIAREIGVKGPRPTPLAKTAPAAKGEG